MPDVANTELVPELVVDANTSVVTETEVDATVPVTTDTVVVESKPITDVDNDGIEDQTPEEVAKYFNDIFGGIGKALTDLADAVGEATGKLKTDKKDDRPEGDKSIQDVFDRGGH